MPVIFLSGTLMRSCYSELGLQGRAHFAHWRPRPQGLRGARAARSRGPCPRPGPLTARRDAGEAAPSPALRGGLPPSPRPGKARLPAVTPAPRPRRRRLPEPFGPCPAPVAPLLQQVVLVLSPDSGRSRHPRTSTHAPAPQPTEKINKPPRTAAGARPRPRPAPRLSHRPRRRDFPPALGSQPPLPAPHRSLQPRYPPRSARPGAPGPVSARICWWGRRARPSPARAAPAP